jgi:hypothetical protein
MFFGAVVKPGKAHPLVPHADGYTLHLSQASLAADVKAGTRASLLVRLGPKESPVVLCTLCAGSQDTVLLDQFLAEYAELSIQGSVPVHLTGYYSPQYGGPDSDAEDEEEEDEEYGVVSVLQSSAAAVRARADSLGHKTRLVMQQCIAGAAGGFSHQYSSRSSSMKQMLEAVAALAGNSRV